MKNLLCYLIIGKIILCLSVSQLNSQGMANDGDPIKPAEHVNSKLAELMNKNSGPTETRATNNNVFSFNNKDRESKPQLPQFKIWEEADKIAVDAENKSEDGTSIDKSKTIEIKRKSKLPPLLTEKINDNDQTSGKTNLQKTKNKDKKTIKRKLSKVLANKKKSISPKDKIKKSKERAKQKKAKAKSKKGIGGQKKKSTKNRTRNKGVKSANQNKGQTKTNLKKANRKNKRKSKRKARQAKRK